jgi:hypothetical protein
VTTRILIFPNKAWETAPLVSVFQNDQARPPRFPNFETPPRVTIPLSDGSTKTVAARLALKTANATAEVWCIQDLMDPAKSASSSEEKARVLPYVTANGAPPSLVIAFGTAALADAHSYNGCVVIGSSVFIHDPYAATPNPESRWTHPEVGKLLDSSNQPVNTALFGQLSRDLRPLIESRFLRPPLNPADPPTLILSSAYVALSNVNVTNQNNYVWADPEALRAFATAEPQQTVGSMETTHGLIRLVVPSPQFLFVSPIANRLGYFNMELAPRSYAQNFAVSHNAGVALAWMMPILMA